MHKHISATIHTQVSLLAVLACLILGLATSATSALNEPHSPLLLFGFEGGEGIKGWTGLPVRSTAAPVSEGSSAMAVTFPKWAEGKDDYPQVAVEYDGGKNYSTMDWSAWQVLSFDVWVKGTETMDLAVALRDGEAHHYGVHFMLQPGMRNTCEVVLDDINTLRTSKVKSLVLFSRRPPNDYEITVDNVRLAKVVPPLAAFDLVYPNYRRMIFPEVKDVRVAVNSNAAEHGLRSSDLSVVATASAGKTSVRSRAAFDDNRALISVSTAGLGEGPVRLILDVVGRENGKTLASETWELTKLSRADVSRLSVYFDERNNAVVDGKPFFPIGWLMNTEQEQLAEVGDSPFNCVLPYGSNYQSRSNMLGYLDRAEQLGLKVMYSLNEFHPSSTKFAGSSWEGVTGNDAMAAAVVRAYRDHPALLSWYLFDEPEKSLKQELTTYYQRISSLDAAHPCSMVVADMRWVKHFRDATDVMMVDPYPIPPNSPWTLPVNYAQITQVSDWTDEAIDGVKGHKPVWIVPQAFGWYQYKSKNPDRGHIPTDEELLTGRAPTYEEERCMTYLALTHGAKGLIYYCYYDMRVLPQYKDMWTWMKSIAEEVRTLSPVLLSHDDPGTVRHMPRTASIHTSLRRHDGRLYLIAVNPERERFTVTFDVKRRLQPQASVMFENRNVNTSGTTFIDTFQPLEAHVYDLGPTR